jgi:putative ABC transport system permease protein
MPLRRVRTLDDILSASMATQRFNMLLLTSFAGLALVLSLIGVYGVVAHAALQRSREIGIRVALGAHRRAVERLIVRGALFWTLPGLALGLAIAYAASRVMTSLLFDVTPTDPLTFASVGAAMLLVSVLASYLPARRAARMDPLVALRST